MKNKSLLISAIAGALAIIVVFTTIFLIKKTGDRNEMTTIAAAETTTIHAVVSDGKLVVNGVEVDPDTLGVDKEDLQEYADKVNKGETKLPETVINYIYQNSPTTTQKSNDSGNDSGNSDTETTKYVKVTDVSFVRTSVSIKMGKSLKLYAACFPLNATNPALGWTSSNKDVASVDHLGNVTGHKLGQVTITATSKDSGKTATCAVTVVENVTTTTDNAGTTTKPTTTKPTTTKPSTTIVRPDDITDPNVIANIREYVTIYNVAANNTKSATDKVTIKKTVNAVVTNFDCSSSLIENSLKSAIQKDFGAYTDTKTFVNGTSGDMTLKMYLPVSGKNYMSSLPNNTDAVKTIVVSNGYPTRIGLQYESATESKSASNHGSCMNIIDPSAISKVLGYKFTTFQIKFYESSITPKFVTVDGQDRLSSVTLKTNFQTVGDAVLSSSYGPSISASFSGYSIETYEFDWQS